MTLSTKAEIEAARRIDRIKDEVRDDINPGAMVEDAVMALEGTEDDPAALDCAFHARQIADDVRDAAADVAGRYADSEIDAKAAAESLGEQAEVEAAEMLADIPTVVCE